MMMIDKKENEVCSQEREMKVDKNKERKYWGGLLGFLNKVYICMKGVWLHFFFFFSLLSCLRCFVGLEIVLRVRL